MSVEMIFNRSQEDVSKAQALIMEKVQKFIPLTDNEILTLEKGTLTINTLNRIETKQQELKNLLNEIGYWDTDVVNKEWNSTEIFNIAEFQRILENENILRKAFFVYKHTPDTPEALYYFQNINDIEQILNDIDVMINNVKSHYKECGNFECGEM